MKPSALLIPAGAVLFGALVYACLPNHVVPLDDDFGYLRSVVATLQHARPWTDDWLEPWAASLSALSAVAYVLTGNFYVATYGLLALLGAISFGLCALLFRERAVPSAPALTFTALGLTCPTVFWKTVQFTSMAVYLPCLFGALLASERRRWGWFFVAWSLAIAARQSALAWIGLPLGAAVASLRSDRRPLGAAAPWPAAITAVAGMLVYLGLQLGMNRTHAQSVITDHLIDHVSFSRATLSAATGVGVALVMSGLGFLCGALTPVSWCRAVPLRKPVVVAALALSALASVAFDTRSLVLWEHVTLSGTVGTVYVKLLVFAGVLGWILGGTALRLSYVTCAALAVGLVCLRGAIWDYYFIDAAVFGFFGTARRDANYRGDHGGP